MVVEEVAVEVVWSEVVVEEAARRGWCGGGGGGDGCGGTVGTSF